MRLQLSIMLLLCWNLRFAQGFLIPTLHARACERLSSTTSTRSLRGELLPCPAVVQSGRLVAKKSDNNDDENSFDGNVVGGDLLALVLACQLIGLVDVLNDPAFWAKGGFPSPFL